MRMAGRPSYGANVNVGHVTVVGPQRGELAVVWVGFPLVGAGAGLLLKSIAGWVTGLAWVPFQGPFELIDSVPEPQATIGGMAVGALAGLVVAFLAHRDYVTVTVDPRQVTVAHAGSTVSAPRAGVSAAFVDGKEIVLLGLEAEELARVGGDLPSAERLGAAFAEHGYPWRPDGDPYRTAFRRWIDGDPDLPGRANALFTARAQALEKGDREDATELRAELAALGYVVREERKRQFWRPTSRVAPGL